MFKLPSIKGFKEEIVPVIQMRSPQRINHHFEPLDPTKHSVVETERRKMSVNPSIHPNFG